MMIDVCIESTLSATAMRTTAAISSDGESAVIALPSEILAGLQCAAGDRVELTLRDDRIELRPLAQCTTLEERLRRFEAAAAALTDEERQADREWDAAPAVGRELV